MPVSGHPTHTITACGTALGGSMKMSKLGPKALEIQNSLLG
jgi:hypothetical protein